MKTRVLSALCGVVLIIAVVIASGYIPVIWNITVAAIVCIALHELLHATGLLKNTLVLILSMICGALVQFVPFINNSATHLFSLFALFAFTLFAVLLKKHSELNFSDISVAFFSTFIISMAFLSFVLLKNNYGIEYVIFMFMTAWVTDIFALFSGMLFGKHKLAPVISPKKTIEGSIGGFICSCIICTLAAYIYSLFTEISINYIYLAVVVIICSVISMIGDLSFSIIKRQCSIKDYGKIMPGHGGVLDRFDSVLFASPTFFILIQYIPIIN